jgi:predicted nuclease of restriction endonuclease-like RecB superfamily
MRYNSQYVTSIRSTLDGFKFDSKLELLTYKKLTESYPFTFIEREPRLIIKPKTVNFDDRCYFPDFKLLLNNTELFIECKGVLTQEFKLKLSLVEYLYPKVFNNLIIVCYQKKPPLKRFCYNHKIKLSTINELPQIIEVNNEYD